MLRERIHNSQAELLVVYGRRRVGKTELLARLASEVRSVYFEATDSVAADQLRDLTAELADASGNEVLRSQPLTTWEAALAALAQVVGDQRTLVVLDEFQLLAARSPELESVLSRWWRTTGRKLPIVLVLAGSELSFFEDEVLAGRLYGRRTGQLRLEPFLAREAALFHPGFSVEDRVRAYSVCGGIPYYLERFPDRRSLEENLVREVFQRTGLLHDEAELMLRQSIAAPANHIAVLRAIAHGHNRSNAIGQRTQLDTSTVAKILATLERLGLIARLRPVTSSERAKKTTYLITDHFLRFHYRFVEPAKSYLRTNELAARYVADSVMPQLDHHASLAWEDICREYVQQRIPEAAMVGRWWGQVPTGHDRRTEERELDVVGVDSARNPLVVGMCKWTTAKVDVDELNLLDRLATHLPGEAPDMRRFLFSRRGFTKRVRALAESDERLTLVEPTDIYAEDHR